MSSFWRVQRGRCAIGFIALLASACTTTAQSPTEVDSGFLIEGVPIAAPAEVLSAAEAKMVVDKQIGEGPPARCDFAQMAGRSDVNPYLRCGPAIRGNAIDTRYEPWFVYGLIAAVDNDEEVTLEVTEMLDYGTTLFPGEALSRPDGETPPLEGQYSTPYVTGTAFPKDQLPAQIDGVEILRNIYTERKAEVTFQECMFEHDWFVFGTEYVVDVDGLVWSFGFGVADFEQTVSEDGHATHSALACASVVADAAGLTMR